ncbi:hypothetical protein [Paenibacillus sp. J22TS3]|uniref:hypothetical protein n=1 Tax=Paenibacillus sp. J22TS3 TaxID=2807192 RepID=UPI001B2F82AD|nr:hypothetical protein [Paenibacillus sp. J22TS3]GIP22023.1 hypothetical protein J22TS3_22980 [Paenibacillus sp. J22TS3]
MDKLKKGLSKNLWVLVAAGLMIIGGGFALVVALNHGLPDNAKLNAENVKMESTPTKANAVTPGGYTLIDKSKDTPEEEKSYKLFLKQANPGHTQEQIDEEYNRLWAHKTPGDKDMTAAQAATYAVDILKKFYAIDLTGYTVTAKFSGGWTSKDVWDFSITKPRRSDKTRSYSVSVDSVTGSLMDMYWGTAAVIKVENKNLGDRAWIKAAVKQVTRLLPEHVTVTGSKGLIGNSETGVAVLCELSDGSDSVVLVQGPKRELKYYQHFPSGYDGSWEQAAADGAEPPCCKLPESGK